MRRWLVWLQPKRLQPMRRYLVRGADPGSYDHGRTYPTSSDSSSPGSYASDSHACPDDTCPNPLSCRRLLLEQGL